MQADLPPYRPLKALTFDPSRGRGALSMTVNVPYEPLRPGPVSDRIEVVDYDASNDCYYRPVDLDDPAVLLRGGLDASEADPRFHQQMAYVVVTETINRFKFALGRDPKWNRGLKRLRVLPHGVQEANAFYSRDLGSLVFGYFQASETDPGSNLPGQVVFTCLSHDIIAHETTHALVDGIRAFFLEPTSVDTPAFHEAFADIVALFQHFTYKDALLDIIQRTGGRIYRPEIAAETRPDRDGPLIQDELSTSNPLVQLARQFGEAVGMRRALRSALGTPPNSRALEFLAEPHARGGILVAAVFDAFFSVYLRRTRDLMRIGRVGGAIHDGDLHPDLANRLAVEATKAAEHFSNICIRALDYCPPLDIQFGDFLRAIITADHDLVPDDPLDYRGALIEAFRLRGIQPEEVTSYAEESLRWRPPLVAEGEGAPTCEGLQFDAFRPPTDEENAHNARLLSAFGATYADKLGLTSGVPVRAYSFHPIHRVGPDGRLKREIFVELVQQREKVRLRPDDAALPTFTFRGGSTLLLEENGKVRYSISKRLGPDDANNRRLARQRAYYAQLDNTLATAVYRDAPAQGGLSRRPLSTLDSGSGDSRPMRFDLIHRGY